MWSTQKVSICRRRIPLPNTNQISTVNVCVQTNMIFSVGVNPKVQKSQSHAATVNIHVIIIVTLSQETKPIMMMILGNSCTHIK